MIPLHFRLNCDYIEAGLITNHCKNRSKSPLERRTHTEEETEQIQFSVAVGFGVPSSINGSDETPGCKSLHLSRVHLIKDGALKFCHIVREEEMPRKGYRLIFIGCSGCVHVSRGVHQSLLISTIITP